ncbi:MAG: DUF2852 domain-containing protein [Phyllobacteriaceae bacterium]|nr:DUF2852 domain-containing protein [Phyllobacteriaceae bacterium]
MNSATDTSGHPAESFRHAHRHPENGDWLWWAKTPGFNPFKLIAVIAGFAVFPPLGVAALVYFLWMGKRHGWQGGQGRHWARHGGCGRSAYMGRTGNTAFDEHQAKAREELEAERRAFDEHRAEQRRKRDAEAFAAFKAGRGAGAGE